VKQFRAKNVLTYGKSEGSTNRGVTPVIGAGFYGVCAIRAPTRMLLVKELGA
jgi:hypothetical protein